MTATSTVREWWSDYWAAGYDSRVVLLGREGVKASDFTLDAWRALEQALQFRGYGDAVWASTYYPRPIGGYECDMDVGGFGCSLHGYSGCAIDIDSLLNPYVRGTSWDFSLCKFTREQVEAVLAVRTNSGVRVWRWGGDFGDYMHWQLDCSPDDIASGVDGSTVAGFVPPDEGDDDVDEFYQKVFDEWDLEDVERMEAKGWWDGVPAYFKGPGATPAFVDVKNLVRKCLANGVAEAAFSDDVSEVDIKALEQEIDDLKTILRSV